MTDRDHRTPSPASRATTVALACAVVVLAAAVSVSAGAAAPVAPSSDAKASTAISTVDVVDVAEAQPAEAQVAEAQPVEAEQAETQVATIDSTPVDVDSASVETVITVNPVTTLPVSGTVVDGGVTLLTGSLPSMTPGQSGWVSLNWQAAKWDATDFRVTASDPSGTVKIAYPENTGSYSSLYRESYLLAGGTDYTSFRLEVSPDARESVAIAFHLSYVLRSSNAKSASVVTQDVTLKLPIVEASDDAVQLATTSLVVSASAQPSWQRLQLTATAPGATGVSVRLYGPTGLAVVYPGDRDAAGLSADANLDQGETDVAAVRLDASALKPGGYAVTAVVTYGRSQGVKRPLQLVVTK